MSDLTLEIQRENEEDEREKFSFYIVHKKDNQEVFTDWLFDYEEDKLQKFIMGGLEKGYKVEIQKLREGESPK